MMCVKKISIILVSFLLSSCDLVNTEPLKGSIDRSSKPITTTVYFYDTVEEVQKKYREIHKLSKDHTTGIQGFAKWPEFRDNAGNPVPDGNQNLTCVIHTVRPSKINDEATVTLGHEMLHCIIGTYHPETK